jgi:hypothetical protein
MSSSAAAPTTSPSTGACIFFDQGGESLAIDAKKTHTYHSQQHLIKSKETIVHAAANLEGTALFVGVRATLPLAELAKDRFKHITLVDRDTGQVQQSVSELPEELQNQFSIEQADLTGILMDLDAKIKSLEQEELSYDAFTSRVLDLLPTLQKSASPYQSVEAAFVCSSLVCSQLANDLLEHLTKICEERYGQPFTPPEGREQELDDHFIQIQLNHIEELHKLAGPDGTVYFADSFSLRRTACSHSTGGTKPLLAQRYLFSGIDRIQARIKELFSIVDQENWERSLPISRSEALATVKNHDRSTSVFTTEVLETQTYEITSLHLSSKKV